MKLLQIFIPDYATNMDRYRSLLAFVQVSELGGFAAAARALGQSTSTISRQVIDLEDWLDVQLLNRTTRHVSLTDAGSEYLEQCKSLVAGIDELEASAKEQLSSTHGKIRVTAPVFMGKEMLGPLLPGFLRRYPDVSVDLKLIDRVVRLVDEGVDLALRIGALSDSSLMARKLGEFNLSLVASDDYWNREGKPTSITDLTRYNCIVDTTPEHGGLWPVGSKGRPSIRVQGNIVVNSGEVARELAISGVGIALLPTFFVSKALKNKQLVAVLEKDIRQLNAGIYLVYPQTKHIPRAVRAFIDYVAEHNTLVSS